MNQQVVVAGMAFGLAMFGAGFCLGVIRVLLVVPLVGELVAVLMEGPFIMFICWRQSKIFVKRLNGIKIRSAFDWFMMGLFAFTTLLFFDIGLAVVAFGKTLEEAIRDLASPKGILGTVGQLVSSFFPLYQVKSKEKERKE